MGKTVAQKFFKRVAKKMEKKGQTYTTGTYSGAVCHRYKDRELLQKVGAKVAKKIAKKMAEVGDVASYRVDFAGDVYVGGILLVCGSTLYQI